MNDRATKILLAVLTAVAVVAWGVYFYISSMPPKTAVTPNHETPPQYTLPAVALEAQSAIVYDLATGQVLFAKDAEAQLPLASVVKLLLAAALPVNERTVTISALDLLPEGDSSLQANEVWRLSDLLDLTLAMSVNDGAHALASVATALAPSAEKDASKNLTRVAENLGLSQTYVIDPTGLDVSSSTSGAYGSAHDMARLIGAILARNPHSLEATAISAFNAESLEGIEHIVINTNPDVKGMPGVLASKTGFTELARGNLALAVDIGFYHPVAVVVLGSSYEGRFSDARKLVEATREAFRNSSLATP